MTDLSAATYGLPTPTAGALRNALEAATPQVFEVTDLPIPAGTDWSGDPSDPEDPNPPYLLGSFDYEARSGGFIIVGYIETAGNTSDEADVALKYGTESGNTRTMATGAYWGDYVELMPGHLFVAAARSEPDPEPVSMKVWISTGIGGVSADITVVRAAASFLVPLK